MSAHLARAFVALALALVGGVAIAPARAHADVWQHALGGDGGESAATIENYEHELAAGDAAVEIAHSGGLSDGNVARQLEIAVDSYRRAALVRPTQAEPYFRIGAVLYAFYIEDCNDEQGVPHLAHLCDESNRRVAQEIIDAWNAAEVRAPDDPLRRSYRHQVLVDVQSFDPQYKARRYQDHGRPPTSRNSGTRLWDAPVPNDVGGHFLRAHHRQPR